jgi:Rieske Fe-S protein
MSEQPESTTSGSPRTSDASAGAKATAVRRRTVLRAAGVGGAGVAGAAALAACGGSSTPPTTGGAASSTTAASATSSTASSSSTATSSETSSGSSSAAAPSGTPVKTADVPVGGGVINAQALFVVTQPSAGQFKAFSATCTHQGCAVTRVENGQIVCPCHMSHFDISTGAPSADSQAKSPLPAKTATVSGDSVYIA